MTFALFSWVLREENCVPGCMDTSRWQVAPEPPELSPQVAEAWGDWPSAQLQVGPGMAELWVHGASAKWSS